MRYGTRHIRPALNYLRQHGGVAFTRLLIRKLFHGVVASAIGQVLPKTDLLAVYHFLNATPSSNGKSLKECDSKTINWFVPMYGRGSGGHLNIFRFVFLLEKLGYKSHIILIDVAGHCTPYREQAKKEIRDWFFPIAAEIYVGLARLPPAHVSFATSWQTVYPLRKFNETRHKCYFVQDFEPWFYSRGSDYALAEETYKFGFVGITAGGWLANKLEAEYGMTTYSVGFSYDAELYRPRPRRAPNIRRIFFYARPPTTRRGFELGLLALHKVTAKLPDVAVCFAGWDISGYSIPFNHLDAGMLTLKDLPDLYSQCDVALILSFSNLSLLPLEIMACGVPIICNKGANNEWLLNHNNARLVDPTPEDIANAICDLLENSDKREVLIKEGLATAAINYKWEKEAGKLAAILESLPPSL